MTFPEESQQAFEELCTLWFEHLSDNIQSVRENTAQSIAQVMSCETYGQVMREKVKQHVKDTLMQAKQQGSESQKCAGLQNVTQFGVAKAAVDGQEDGQIKEKDSEDLAHQNN